MNQYGIEIYQNVAKPNVEALWDCAGRGSRANYGSNGRGIESTMGGGWREEHAGALCPRRRHRAVLHFIRLGAGSENPRAGDFIGA